LYGNEENAFSIMGGHPHPWLWLDPTTLAMVCPPLTNAGSVPDTNGSIPDTKDNVDGAVIMDSHCKSSASSSVDCRTVPVGHWPFDRSNQLQQRVCL